VIKSMPWARDAACTKAPPDTLFVRGAAQRSARELCFTCPVRMSCLAEALESESDFGVWGGMTERARRALLKRPPRVPDWAAWLAEPRGEVEPPQVRARRARALAGVTA